MKWNLMLVVALFAVPAFGASITLQAPGGGSSIMILPGQSAQIQVKVDTGGSATAGFDAQIKNVKGDTFVSITGRTWAAFLGPAMGDFPLATNVNHVPPGLGQVASPARNLGLLIQQDVNIPAFNDVVETLTIKVAANAIGYPLQLTLQNLKLSDGDSNPITGVTTNVLTITPEPASLLLLGLGGLFLRRRSA